MPKPKSLPYEAPEIEGAYSVDLHSEAGGSDKVYKIAIEAAEPGTWVVNYANGRRGGTLATGTKTKTPVPYAEARKACNAVLFDKVGGGYVPTGGSRFGDGMKAEAIAAIARESSGHVPQLSLAIEADGVEALLRDDAWVAERKHNGERRFLVVKDGEATGGNRRAQTVALPARVREAASALPDVVLDCEIVGDRLHFWDMVSYKGMDLRDRPLEHRLKALDAAAFDIPGVLTRTATARGEEAKRALLKAVMDEGEEGVVFKRLDARYDPGKPGSGATWRKFKLWNSLSAVVTAERKGRSVSLHLVGADGEPVDVGGVTVPANHAIPAAGSVVEIRYLYAFEGGGLHQPVFEGPRPDLTAADCPASQRAFKPVEVPASLEDESAGPRP